MPTTIRRGAAFAAALGALAVAAAGCGGAGSAGGVSAGATATTSGTSTGGVLGAQANVGSAQLRVQANDVMSMVNRQLNKLSGVGSAKQLSQVATSTRTRVLQAADRLDQLDLSSPQAQQERQNLESALRSVAADITTLKGDARSGSLSKAIDDLQHLSSVDALRAAVQNIRTGKGTAGQQSLAAVALGLASGLQSRVSTIRGLNTRQGLTNHIAQLQSYLQRTQRTVSGLTMPQSQQQTKQQLLTFLREWRTDLQSAKQHARQGQLKQARQMAAGLGYQDLQSLISKLQGNASS